VALREEDISIKPIFRDDFDRYSTALAPIQGGWLLVQDSALNIHDDISRYAQPTSVSVAGLFSLEKSTSRGLQSGLSEKTGIQAQSETGGSTKSADSSLSGKVRQVAEIDETEYLTPSKSFRLKCGAAGFPVIKKFTLPEHVPYDVSSSNFAIVAERTLERMELKTRTMTKEDRIRRNIRRLPRERREIVRSAPRSGQTRSDNTRSIGRTAVRSGDSGGGALTSFPVRPAGIFYIYSYDNRLLAEYDIYGNCMRDYIYFGSRLVAEYDPPLAQYLYYTPDNIGSTRMVTNNSGDVVYSNAFNPYGGIQQAWIDDFNPIQEYSGKERDEESGMDYFGARYYEHSSYRWTSPDPIIASYDYDPKH